MAEKDLLPNDLYQSSFWEKIDAILVINLDEREDRWEAFLNEFEGILPSDKVHRISAVYGKSLRGYGELPWFRGRKRDAVWAARAGCILSHRAACAMAKENTWDTVLILEDDVIVDENFIHRLSGLNQSIWASGIEWDILYMGYIDPEAPYLQLHTYDSVDWIRLSGCNAAHSYLLKAEARDWILDQLPPRELIWSWTSRFRAIDRWYRRHLSRHFVVTALSVSLFNQAYGYSDIEVREKTSLDKMATSHICAPYSSKWGFKFRLMLKNAFHRIYGVYDFLRSIQKRLKGF